jgi:hypothetical protein
MNIPLEKHFYPPCRKKYDMRKAALKVAQYLFCVKLLIKNPGPELIAHIPIKK